MSGSESLTRTAILQASKTEALRNNLWIQSKRRIDPIIFQGVTENATPTELFIDNIPNYRLELPPNSVGIFHWIGSAFNLTDGVGTTHGNVAAEIGNFTARRATTAFALVGSATGTSFVFTANDTTDQIICTVTGVASKRIFWQCHLDRFSVTAGFAAEYSDGIYTGRQ